MTTLSELRRHFEEAPECQFVSPDDFVARMTGHEPLIRSDEPAANLLGLLDERTGSRYLVPAEDFMKRRDEFVMAH